MRLVHTVLIAAAISMQLAGCIKTGQVVKDEDVTNDQRDFLRSESSGQTGCPAQEINVTNVSGKWGIYLNWTASCKGQAYQCSTARESGTSCTAAK